jgi:hypothetical protein
MNPYEPIFSQISLGLLEMSEIKPNYTDKALLDVTLIFHSVFMDKLFDKQNFENMPIDERMEMAKNAGEDLRKLINKYTGLDTHNLTKT